MTELSIGDISSMSPQEHYTCARNLPNTDSQQYVDALYEYVLVSHFDDLYFRVQEGLDVDREDIDRESLRRASVQYSRRFDETVAGPQVRLYLTSCITDTARLESESSVQSQPGVEDFVFVEVLTDIEIEFTEIGGSLAGDISVHSL